MHIARLVYNKRSHFYRVTYQNYPSPW